MKKIEVYIFPSLNDGSEKTWDWDVIIEHKWIISILTRKAIVPVDVLSNSTEC